MIYLNNSSYTFPAKKVLDAAKEALSFYGEKDPAHFLRQNKEASLRSLIGPQEGDFLQSFSSYKDALHLLYHTIFFDIVYQSGKNHLLTLSSESEELVNAICELEKADCTVSFLEVEKNGLVSLDTIKKAINPRTAIVSMSWACNQTGLVQPIYEIGTFLAEKGILFHVDVTSIIGKLFFRLQDYPIDFLTLNGSLIHAFPESGVLAAQKHSFPLEQSLLSSRKSTSYLTEKTMEAAAEEILHGFDDMCGRVAMMRNFFEEDVLTHCNGTSAPFKERERLPNIATITFPKIHATLLSYTLMQEGIVCEIDPYSAIFKNSIRPEEIRGAQRESRGEMNSLSIQKVYQNAGVSLEDAMCTLSFSLSRYQTEEEMEKAAEVIRGAFSKLQSYSREISFV